MICAQESGCTRHKDIEGVRRTTCVRAWLEGGEESCRPNEAIIAYWYSMSMITLSDLFAWGWRGRKLESRNQKLEIGKEKKGARNRGQG